MNASRVNYNQDNGVNVTYDGGWRIFNMSTFSHNVGNGINVTVNETRVDNKTRYAREQRLEVAKSEFVFNDGFGVRVGNCCVAGSAVINDSYFSHNQHDAIEMESCYKLVPSQNMTNFTIGYNVFEANYGHAIKISPMINVYGRIANNTFDDHPRHTLLIDNTDDFLLGEAYGLMNVSYEVMGNTFRNNRGFYVANLRLSHRSRRQKLDFKYNVFDGNVIEGAFPTLNERARAYAVAVVSSDNVNFSRNHLVNPDSTYEVATHLLDKSYELDISRQWWGTYDYEIIAERKIFDQYSRYDLPRLQYHPCLKSDNLYSNVVTDDQDPHIWNFERGDTIGGHLLDEFHTTPGKTYKVDRDIIIIKTGANGLLFLTPGTTLEFENSIGMLVQNELQSVGNEAEQVTLRLQNTSTYHNSSLVRLVDGPNQYEGRVEIRPEGEEEWGTICREVGESPSPGSV